MQHETATHAGMMTVLAQAEELDADVEHLREQYAYGVERHGPRHGLVIDLGAMIQTKQVASAAAHRRGLLRLAGF
jgi:hypothetical protein